MALFHDNIVELVARTDRSTAGTNRALEGAQIKGCRDRCPYGRQSLTGWSANLSSVSPTPGDGIPNYWQETGEMVG